MKKEDGSNGKIILQILNEIERLIDKKLENHESSQNQKPYMNKKEAAAYVGVSVNTLNKWVELGLPVIDVGGVKLISQKDIVEFLENHK